MPAAETATGFDLHAAPARAGRTRVTLRAPAPLALVVNGEPVVWPGAARRDHRRERRRPVPDDRHRLRAAAGDDHRRRSRRPLPASDPRPPGSGDQALPYVREDVTALVLKTAERALQLADAMLCDATCLSAKVLQPLRAPDRRSTLPITLIEAPLRHQLVQVHGNVILVSDQNLRSSRSTGCASTTTRAGARGPHRAGRRPDWRHRGACRSRPGGGRSRRLSDGAVRGRSVQEAGIRGRPLRPLDFVPAVDQLIYAPLLASSSSYFGDVQDEDRVATTSVSSPTRPPPARGWSTTSCSI